MHIDTYLVIEFILRIAIVGLIYFFVALISTKRTSASNRLNDPSIVALFLLYFGILVLNLLSLYIPSLFISPNGMAGVNLQNYPLFNPLLSLVLHIAIIFICYSFIKRYLGQDIVSIFYKKDVRHRMIKWLLYIYLVFAPICFVLFEIGTVYDMEHGITNYLFPHPLMSFMILGVVIPLSEELLFRGVLYNGFKKNIGVFWAAIISSILFAITHQTLNIGTFSTLLLSGIIYSICYEKGKALIIPISIHSVLNILRVFFNSECGIAFTLSYHYHFEFWVFLFAIIASIILFILFVRKKK